MHLAVDDCRIIIAHHVAGACVNDSQVAIPLMRMADKHRDYLYALMDGGYTSQRIEEFAISIGKATIMTGTPTRTAPRKKWIRRRPGDTEQGQL